MIHKLADITLSHRMLCRAVLRDKLRICSIFQLKKFKAQCIAQPY